MLKALATVYGVPQQGQWWGETWVTTPDSWLHGYGIYFSPSINNMQIAWQIVKLIPNAMLRPGACTVMKTIGISCR